MAHRLFFSLVVLALSPFLQAQSDSSSFPQAPLEIEYITFDTLDISTATTFRIGVRAYDTLQTVSALLNQSEAYYVGSQPAARGTDLPTGQVHEFTGTATPSDSGEFIVSAEATCYLSGELRSSIAWSVIYITDTLRASFSISEAVGAFGTAGEVIEAPEEFDLLSNGGTLTFDDEEYDSTWSDDDTTLAKQPNGWFTVKGYLYYSDPRDPAGTLRPAANVQVSILDDDVTSEDDFLGKTFTDWDGYFEKDGIDTDDHCLFCGGVDVYIKYESVNPWLEVKSAFFLPNQGPESKRYEWRHPDQYNNVQGGTILDFGNYMIPQDGKLPAMWVMQYATLGADKIISQGYSGWSPKLYRWGGYEGSGISATSVATEIGDDAADAIDLINWANGVHLMYEAYEGFPDECSYGSDYFTSSTCKSFAWKEGWNHFFPLCVNNDGSFDTEPYGAGVEVENTSSVSWDQGAEVVGRVTAALLDLWDEVDDGDDENSDYPISLEDIYVNTMLGSYHDNFEEFWDDLKVNTVSDPYAHRGIRAIANNTIEFTGIMSGDADGSGSVAIGDANYIISYIFSSGPEPIPYLLVGDVDCSGGVSIGDAVYIANWIFGGPAPCIFQ